MKNHLRIFQIALLFCALHSIVKAQCLTRDQLKLDGNKVSASFTNGAQRFWDLSSTPHYEVPKGSGKNSLFAASPWVGGLDDQGALHLAASTYRQGGNDYYAGPIRRGTTYDCGRLVDTDIVRGMQLLSGGKLLLRHPGSLTVMDMGTQASLQRILPNGFGNNEALELANGDVLILGWSTLPSLISQALIFDTAGFPIPTPDTLVYRHNQPQLTLMPDGKVLVVSSIGVEIFDPVTHTSQAKAPMLLPRVRMDLGMLPNGKAIVVGGLLNTSTEVYDPGTDTWSAGPTMQVPRSNFPKLLTMPGGDILLYGGGNQDSLMERYDANVDSFLPLGYLPSAQVGYTAVPVSANELLLAGNSPSHPANGIQYLNLQTWALRDVHFQPTSGYVATDGNCIATTYAFQDQIAFLNPITGHIKGHRWDRVWKVSRAEVNQFLADFAGGTLDSAAYLDLMEWPGNGDISAGEDAQLAPYIDVDNDGVYDPVHDGDYPCFPGDQAIWWVFNDDGTHEESGGTPLGFQFENLSWVVDCSVSPCPDSSMDYATFHHMEVTNYGSSDYTELRLGTFMDTDLGNYADDYIGSDSALGLAFWYNGDANDETAAGYGLNPPAAGFLALSGDVDTLSSVMYIENDFAFPSGWPATPTEYYYYLRAQWKDGSHLVNNGLDGVPFSGPGAATNFVYSGDPGFCGGASTGWSEASAGNAPFDRRIILGMAPTSLAMGESLQMDHAILWARDAGNLTSVCKLKADAAVIKQWWATTADKSCFSLVMDRPQPQLASPFSIYPNPSTGRITLDLGFANARTRQVEVVDLHGRSLWKGEMGKGLQAMDLDLSALPPAVYVIQVEGALAQKLVLTR